MPNPTSMTARLLEGRPIATRIRADVNGRAFKLLERNIQVHLRTFAAQADEEGTYYAESLRKVGDKVGVKVTVDIIPSSALTDDFAAAVAKAAAEPSVHGIIVQRPLPAPLDLLTISQVIPPEKDVDGASPLSFGLLAQGMPRFVPATAAAVIEMLRQPELPAIAGARAAVLGRSVVVGRPVAYLLTAADATVTLCHSRTRELGSVCRSSDIIVAAIGKPRLIDASYVKRGATVIDVGTNLIEGNVVGDVDTEAVGQVAGAISPVPGGVGVVTTSILLRNTVRAAELLAGEGAGA